MVIDLLIRMFCFFAPGGQRGDCGENGNAFALLSAIKAHGVVQSQQY